MVTTLQPYTKEIVTVLSALAIWALNYFVKPRAKLVRGVRHAFTFLVDAPLRNEAGEIVQPHQLVNTASITLINAGRDTANGVEVTFNYVPQYYNIWPQRHFESDQTPDGRFTIKFNSMAPKEFINFELLAVERGLPGITSARCDECVAVEIPIQPQEIHPRRKLIFYLWLVVVGGAAHVYFLLTLLGI